MTKPRDAYDSPEDPGQGTLAGHGTGADVVEAADQPPQVGRADADADRAGAYGDAPQDGASDLEDVPVGAADADEDARQAGAG